MKSEISRPFRWVGPYTAIDSKEILRLVFDSVRIETALMDFATGDLDPQQLLFEIQSIFERAELELKAARADGNYPSRKEGA